MLTTSERIARVKADRLDDATISVDEIIKAKGKENCQPNSRN